MVPERNTTPGAHLASARDLRKMGFQNPDEITSTTGSESSADRHENDQVTREQLVDALSAHGVVSVDPEQANTQDTSDDNEVPSIPTSKPILHVVVANETPTTELQRQLDERAKNAAQRAIKEVFDENPTSLQSSVPQTHSMPEPLEFRPPTEIDKNK